MSSKLRHNQQALLELSSILAQLLLIYLVKTTTLFLLHYKMLVRFILICASLLNPKATALKSHLKKNLLYSKQLSKFSLLLRCKLDNKLFYGAQLIILSYAASTASRYVLEYNLSIDFC